MPVFIILIVLVLIVGALGYCMKPMPMDNMRKARFKSFEHHYIAHQGLHDNKFDAPENTMAAFKRAISCGFGVTIDVRLTKDKKLVCVSDENLSRLCGENVTVAGTDHNVIKGYNVKGTNQTIPLLSEVLTEIDGRVPVIINIKPTPAYDEVCRLLVKEINSYTGDIAIASLSPEIVEWFKINHSDILRGQIGVNMFAPHNQSNDSLPDKLVTSFMLKNFKSQPDFIVYDFVEFDSLFMKAMRGFFGAETAGMVMTSQKCIDDLANKFDIAIFEGFTPREKDNILY